MQVTALQQTQDKVAQLRCELICMAAEREEPVTKAAVATHVLRSVLETKNNNVLILGPTLKVGGCSTEALINTGSPLSLVSIGFLSITVGR